MERKFAIREIKKHETSLLETFLYEAIFQRDESNLLPKSIIEEPELKMFIEDFGKRKGDYCLVATTGVEVIGAVWVRILSGEIKGFGNIDDQTPEFAISVLKQFRGQNIGTKLMKQMLISLRNKGYKQASLSVQKDNYAVQMYKAIGFKPIKETEEEFVMVYTF